MPGWFRYSLVVPVCLLLAGSARAQNTQKLIEAATKEFVALNFERSLGQLDAALRTKGNRKADLLRIYGLQALCFLSLSMNAEAEKAFTSALSIDPAFRLGPEVSPRFSEPFEKLLQRGVPELKVEVTVPAQVTQGEPVSVSVKLAADPANLSDSVVFFYRRAGAADYASEQVRLIRGKQIRFLLEPGLFQAGGVEPVQWYYRVLDRHGGELYTLDPANPKRLQFRPKKKVVAATTIPPPPASSAAAAPAWYEKWWVWAIIGGVAAAAGTTAVVLAGSDGEAASHRDFSIDIR